MIEQMTGVGVDLLTDVTFKAGNFTPSFSNISSGDPWFEWTASGWCALARKFQCGIHAQPTSRTPASMQQQHAGVGSHIMKKV